MMKQIRLTGLILLLLGLGLAAVVTGQPVLQLAAVQNDAPVLVDAAGGVQPLAAPPAHTIASLAWSFDGQLLALVANDEDYTPHLYVSGPDMAQPIALNTGPLEVGFGVAFTPDGQIIYAAQGVFPPDYSTPPVVELRQIAPDASAQPVVLGQFTHMVGCGGGSPIPADWQVWGESGFGGDALALQWTPLGILHSTSCNGGSAALLNPSTGADLPLGPAFDPDGMMPDEPISRLTVSPDGMQIAGVRSTFTDTARIMSLVLIDPATGAVTDVPTAAQPDQLVWSADGVLIYSTRSLSRDVAASFDGKDRGVLAAALGYSPAEDLLPLNAFVTGIRQLDLTTGADEELLSLDVYAVGRMRQAADGTLVFSTVANLDAWAQAIVSGTFDPATDEMGEQARALVPVSVYQLPPGAAAPQLIGEHLAAFELRPEPAVG